MCSLLWRGQRSFEATRSVRTTTCVVCCRGQLALRLKLLSLQVLSYNLLLPGARRELHWILIKCEANHFGYGLESFAVSVMQGSFFGTAAKPTCNTSQQPPCCSRPTVERRRGSLLRENAWDLSATICLRKTTGASWIVVYHELQLIDIFK